MNNEAAPPQPAPGSNRFFVLLYTPAPRRAALQVLLAIADELTAGLARELEHSVAHLRLQWWADELMRLTQGSARHPWLVSLPSPRPAWPDLQPLAHAATLDLATHRLAARREQALAAAVFVAAAQLLGPSIDIEIADGALRTDLQLLGRFANTLEAAASGESWAQEPATQQLAALRERQQQAPLLATGPQHTLAPLLVWVALALHRSERAHHRQPGPSQLQSGSATMHDTQPGRFDGLMDNLIAWRAARRAMRGRFRIPNA